MGHPVPADQPLSPELYVVQGTVPTCVLFALVKTFQTGQTRVRNPSARTHQVFKIVAGYAVIPCSSAQTYVITPLAHHYGQKLLELGTMTHTHVPVNVRTDLRKSAQKACFMYNLNGEGPHMQSPAAKQLRRMHASMSFHSSGVHSRRELGDPGPRMLAYSNATHL